jgi:chromosome segregation ATPase
MSTILDALKQVEERIRNEALQKSGDGLPGGVGAPKGRIDASIQLKNAAAGENDDVMAVYSGIVDMLTRIQDRLQTALDEGRAEARTATAELAKALTAVQNEFLRQREAIQREFQKLNVEREAGNAALAELQSKTDSLKRMLADTGGTKAELGQTLAALANDVARQREAVQAAFHKRDAEREAGNAALAAVQSQTDALKRLFAEVSGTNAELAQALAALRNDFAGQTGAIQAAFGKRDAEREAGNARLTAAQSQADALKTLVAELGGANAGLTRTVAGLQNDFTRQAEAVQEEFKKRDAGRETGIAEMAAMHSQTDALIKSLGETRESHAELAQAMAAIKNDCMRRIEAVQAEFAQDSEKRDGNNAASTAAQSDVNALKGLLAETRESHAQLAQAMAAIKNDCARRIEAVQAEFAQDSEKRDGNNAASTAAQSDVNALKGLLAETRESHAQLAQAMAAIKNDCVRRIEAVQAEFAQDNKKRDGNNAASTAAQSDVNALKGLLAETRESHAQLAQAMTALKNDFLRQSEAVEKEFQSRDAERKAANDALTEMRTQTDALRQLLAGRERAATDTLAAGLLAGATDAGAPLLQDTPHGPDKADGANAAAKERIGREDALKLHAAARKAYTKGNLPEALQLLDMIDAAFPGNASVLYNRAQCLIGLGRNDEARTLCDHLVNDLDHAPAKELKRQIKD